MYLSHLFELGTRSAKILLHHDTFCVTCIFEFISSFIYIFIYICVHVSFVFFGANVNLINKLSYRCFCFSLASTGICFENFLTSKKKKLLINFGAFCSSLYLSLALPHALSSTHNCLLSIHLWAGLLVGLFLLSCRDFLNSNWHTKCLKYSSLSQLPTLPSCLLPSPALLCRVPPVESLLLVLSSCPIRVVSCSLAASFFCFFCFYFSWQQIYSYCIFSSVYFFWFSFRLQNLLQTSAQQRHLLWLFNSLLEHSGTIYRVRI